MIYCSTERAKIALIRVLELAFQTNMQFKWDQDPDKSRIRIYKQWPKTDVKLPSVIITAAPGDPLMRTIGQDVRRQITSPVMMDGITRQVVSATQYGGSFQPSLNIEVASNDTMERDRIIDWISMYIRWFFWDKFRDFGIEFQSMRWNSDREDRLGNDWVYISSMSLDLLTEWNHTVTIDDASRLNAICIASVFVVNYDGTTN